MFRTFLRSARHALELILVGAALVACGGAGGGGGVGDGPAPPPDQLALMQDSFGRFVQESAFGAGDSGAAGADGSAGDGAPIPNAAVTLIDNAGHSVNTLTDAQGYYRVSVKGFSPPFIAKVARADGSVWYSPSVQPVMARRFITINITGLTDKLAGDVAAAAGRTGAAQLTPALLGSNLAALQAAKANLNGLLATQIVNAGLNTATFDPVMTPFQAVLADPYDRLLESIILVKNESGVTTVTPKFKVGGTISGLGSSTDLLLGNGSETLSITANASTFTFATLVAEGANYAIRVVTQPQGLTCSVSNGAGVVGHAAVTNAAVVCSAVTHSLGGTVTGLGSASGLVLSNAGQTVTVAANATSFVFPLTISQGSAYSVVVQSQPANRTCSVSNGVGVVGDSLVNSVVVSCSVNAYELGGSVSGLSASGLSLGNGGHFVNVPANATSFVFPAKVASGSPYNVVVLLQPTGLNCVVSNGAGTVTNAPVTTVAISCSVVSYPLGGTINGLTSSGLVLAVGNQTLAVTSGSTSFTFPAPILSGTTYNVGVQSQPSGRTCSVSNGVGTISGGPVSTVVVNCSANSYSLGGNLTSLTSSGLILASGGQTVAVPAGATAFTFPAPIASGTGYNVTVQAHPAGRTCSVSNGIGAIANSDVTSVNVDCSSPAYYSLGGSIIGLTANGLMLVTVDGGQSVTPSAGSTSFTFPTLIASGVSYVVVIESQPSGLSCTVSGGSGVMTTADVNNVSVQCFYILF